MANNINPIIANISDVTSFFGLYVLKNPLAFYFTVVLWIIPLLWFAKNWFSGINKNQKYSLPPGPKPWPILGCIPQMVINKPAFRWIHKLMEEMNTEIACILLGNVNVITVTSPEISREFLRKQDAIFLSRPITMASELASRGFLSTVLSSPGEQWKKMKKIMATELLSPAKHHFFHSKRIEEADHLVRYIYNQSKGSRLVNLRVAAQQYCGNVIRKIVFNKRFFGKGMEDGGPGVEEEEHMKAAFTSLFYVFSFCVSDYLPFLRWWFDLDGHEKVMREAEEIFGRYTDPIIDERILQWKNETKKQVQHFLDALISLKDERGNPLLTPDEIKSQIADITKAAVDNPSNAVEWAIAEMLNKPEIMQKAVEELDRVVGKERLVQESDFPKLNYVKACAREAFRLHPIAPFNLPHVSTMDTTVCNYFIPKGSHVLLSRLGLGRNPRVWPDPYTFKPERHLEEGSEVELTETDLRFISFSTGRRGCMAVVLGTSMTVMLFARILHGFTWAKPPGVSRIDLLESEDSLALAKPLVAVATPRLPAHVYQS